MDNQKKLLFKEGRKYKNLLENMTLNPFAYPVNGRNYHYMIYHRKRPNDLDGYAIISLDNGPEEDYKQALYPLVLMSAASANIFKIAQKRATIYPEYFEGLIEVIENENNPPVLQNAKELFTQLLPIIRRFNELYHTYENYYDNDILKRKILTEEDIDHTVELLSRFDYLQYQQGILLQKYDPFMPKAFRYFRKIKRKMPKELWDFIRGFQSNHHNISKVMKEFDYDESILHLPEDEQVEHLIDYVHNSAVKWITDREKKLRGIAAK